MRKLLKRVYSFLPFKREVYLALRALVSPPERIYKHLHFKGPFSVYVDKQSSFRIMHYGYQVENEIFWAGLEGGWEKVSFGLWIKLSRNARVIMDVGANTGIYALIAKAVNPGSRVYAFEPVKRVFEKLESNNRLNGYDIRCNQVALSNYNGMASIYDTATEHVYSVTVNKNLYSEGTTTVKTEIPVRTLDKMIEEDNLTGLDLIKIDVETHEAEVLEGFGPYLARFRPAMLIEVLNDEVGQRVESIVAGLDYMYFNIDERKGVTHVDHIRKSDFFNYLLCSESQAKELGLVQ